LLHSISKMMRKLLINLWNTVHSMTFNPFELSFDLSSHALLLT